MKYIMENRFVGKLTAISINCDANTYKLNVSCVCGCPEGTAGMKCELTCENHKCENSGKCLIENGKVKCR